jgi:hypothetical protein
LGTLLPHDSQRFSGENAGRRERPKLNPETFRTTPLFSCVISQTVINAKWRLTMDKIRRNRFKSSGATPIPTITELPQPSTTPRAAWRIAEWAASVGCCRASVYNLHRRGEIELISLGRMTFVRPGPTEFLDGKASANQGRVK